MRPICPAATVLLTRDSPRGLEVLLVQRARELAFHGGAWVFPGGRVEACDESQDGELSSALRAAIRETYEEAGMHLEGAQLLPFSHWTTPDGQPRRFATWFFVTEVLGELECRVDGREICAHRWVTPRVALAAQAQGDIALPPPTYVSLVTLSAFATPTELLTHARASTPCAFVPRPRQTEDGVVSLLQGDVAYEGGDLQTLGPRHRLNMLRSGYRYEREL